MCVLPSILFTYPELGYRARQGLHVPSERRVMQGNGAGRRLFTVPSKRLVVCKGRQPLATAGEGAEDGVDASTPLGQRLRCRE